MTENSTLPTADTPLSPITFDCIFQEHQWLIVFTTALGGAIAFMGRRFPEHILLGIAVAVTFFIVLVTQPLLRQLQ